MQTGGEYLKVIGKVFDRMDRFFEVGESQRLKKIKKTMKKLIVYGL